MKIAMIIVRSLMGALFVFGAIMFFFVPYKQPALAGDLKTFMEGLTASGYLLKLIKGTELVCGLALLVNRFVPLALVILCPIIINILFVHAILMPQELPIAIILLAAELFLAWYHRANYKGLLAAKPM